VGLAGDGATVGRVDPKVGRSGVGDNVELLGGGTNINSDEVLGVGVVLDGNLGVLIEEEISTSLHEGFLGNEATHGHGLVVNLNTFS
jgi:hypothetical protein